MLVHDCNRVLTEVITGYGKSRAVWKTGDNLSRLEVVLRNHGHNIVTVPKPGRIGLCVETWLRAKGYRAVARWQT
eukprot:6463961-Amphidinium_carterae.2